MSEPQSSVRQSQPIGKARSTASETMMTRVPVAPGAMLGLRQAYDVTLSPDGQWVAFTLSEFVADQQKAQSRIWIVETSGKGEAQPLSKGPKADMSPRWSPDSQQVAYVSIGEGDKEQLYVIAAPDGEAKCLCT